MKTDIQIAQEAELYPIVEVAKSLGMRDDELELFGKYKAKISDEYLDKISDRPNGKLILVTAINPTPAGEGKTTTSVGLGQAFGKLGKKAVIALREPSLGPCFGVKGGAAGGGFAQVVPMEDLNLHFTGDFHAITSANNLLAAILDNHIQQGNELGIDTRQVVWKRCLDMNDRVLRNVVVGLGAKTDGTVREDHFVITVASEIMAVLCLACDLKDLKKRLGRMVVAYNYQGEPVTAADLNAVGAMAVLLKDAMKPNLIQTLEHTPALVHGGPFANIAHGCNSLRATKAALKMADYVVTEAGFGADLGAEKFFDIKCRIGNLKPDVVVLVATIRALKYNGGVPKAELGKENLDALKAGIVNLEKHMENLQKYGVPVVVTLNSFMTDTEEEVAYVKQFCEERDCAFALSQVWEKGGEGGIALANAVLDTLERKESNFQVLYEDTLSLEEKIEKVAGEIYGAEGVNYSAQARTQLQRLEKLGFGNLPDAALPETLWSLPVTALGDHALTPGAGAVPGQEVLVACGPLPPDVQWDNRNLRELTLPASLERMGDYALFNCASLKKLCLGDGVQSWGGGAIMNCRSLDTFQVDCTGREGELLAYFAGELPGELDVELRRGGETAARLIFPEYVEVYEENCPAHHFDYSIYGAGYGYHHCFYGKKLDLRAYDALWRPMLAMEYEAECALRLAWWRLRYPAELTDRAGEGYRAYLRAHTLEAVRWLLSAGHGGDLGLLLAEAPPDRASLSAACALARERGDAAVLALLLEEQHRRFPAGAARDFTL